MIHKYVNTTSSTKNYLLQNEARTKVSQITLATNGVMELNYPGLDIYVPHMLSKISPENGEDLSHLVVRAREEAAKNIKKAEKAAEKAAKVEEPKVEEVKTEEPKVEEVKVEEPKVEEVKTEEPKVETPKKKGRKPKNSTPTE